MASDPLRSILKRLQVDPPLFRADEVRSCFGPALADLESLGVLRKATPSRSATCTHCGGGHTRRVEFVTHAQTGDKHGYICCPECGTVAVPLDGLKRWEVDVQRFLVAVTQACGIAGPPTEVVPGRLWRLGKATWAQRSRELYFARACRRGEHQTLVTELARRPKAILLMPGETGASKWGDATNNLVLALESMLSLDQRKLLFDRDYVEGRLVDAGLAGAARAKPPAKKRAERAAKIEALKNELIEHLQAARNHAHSTKQQTGTPKLLPRPTQKALAKRAKMTEADVSRCLKDESARELKLDWNTAADLDLIMNWKGGIRRRKAR